MIEEDSNLERKLRRPSKEIERGLEVKIRYFGLWSGISLTGDLGYLA